MRPALLATVLLLAPAPACASEFRSLLSFISGETQTIGDSVNGNRDITIYSYRNASSRSFIIYGVVDVQSLDPEDLGFTEHPTPSTLAAMELQFPSYDLFIQNYWESDVVTPRKTWKSTILFDLPIVVNPGETFSYVGVHVNDTFGPDLPAATDRPIDEIGYFGEVTAAIDLDWSYWPTNADFDSDGDVDGKDFLRWQQGLGATGAAATLANGDANDDAVVNGLDLAAWRHEFAEQSSASAVPEPSSAALAVFLLIATIATAIATRQAARPQTRF